MTLSISRDTYEAIENRFDDLRDDYSGRGMYGKSCFGIVMSGDGFQLAVELMDLANDWDDENVVEDIQNLLEHHPSEDSMGYERIFYWPNFTVDEE